jgi:tetratricopeptide (TPR) repeat protein
MDRLTREHITKNMDFENWYSRGVELDSLSKYEEAIEAFDRALAIKSNQDKVWCNRGLCLGLLNKIEEAIVSFDRALEINQNNDNAWFYRGDH